MGGALPSLESRLADAAAAVQVESRFDAPVMRPRPAGPLDVVGRLWRHREIVWQMSRREVLSRYRGSTFGLFWSVLQPLALLALYSFVFGMVFQTRWGMPVEGRGEFALVLFAGLVVYTIFSECVLRAPLLVLAYPSYVKRVVFPLEVLPWVAMASALFHAMVSLGVLLVACLALHGTLPWTVVTIPLVLLPCVLFTLALTWFLSALGVYFRDTVQVVGLFTTAVMFVSPIFYSVTALPERIRWWVRLSPLTTTIEQLRAAVFLGEAPRWPELAASVAVGLVAAWAGLRWFERTRPGFADVL
jgi:lipopolysaccharide transport system permease protein